ncbi:MULTISPECIES: hypothetical protein [Aeromonas]|nr:MULTISPECIES: hypothetical protein [Aeromonas]AXV19532.1 hypothetical protein C7U63_05710 [Aeromonas veronii]MCJ8214117.1 hypothetical protein [Aeromonas veronii]MCX0445623.1 hypothetical protein [Aeromonas veronii]MVG14468.1 hypothetical protein [Aeromonas jandaei]RUR54129.1 hypothetical protein ELS78_17210 [Aeromonas veronii]
MTLQAWEWMCQQETFLIKDVIAVTGMSEAHIYKVVRDWLAAGHLIKHPDGVVSRPAYFKVVSAQYMPPIGKSSGQKRPKCRNKRKTNQQKMWNTMKISRFFTLTDLMLTAETGQKQAWFYTDRLVKAGYVKVLFKVDSLLPVPARHGLTGRYQLVRDTGRYAPLCRDHGCWDQNQQQLYPFQREEETHGNVA